MSVTWKGLYEKQYENVVSKIVLKVVSQYVLCVACCE